MPRLTVGLNCLANVMYLWTSSYGKKKHNLLIKIEVMKESEYITYTLVFMV